MKQDFGENSNWQYVHEKLAWAKKNRLRIENYMKIIPVAFGQEGGNMLVHCKNLLESEDSLIAINPKYDKLLTGLRGSVAQEFKLLKEETPFSDLVDAFRLACKFFTLKR